MYTQPGKEGMEHKSRRQNKIWLGDELHPPNMWKDGFWKSLSCFTSMW